MVGAASIAAALCHCLRALNYEGFVPGLARTAASEAATLDAVRQGQAQSRRGLFLGSLGGAALAGLNPSAVVAEEEKKKAPPPEALEVTGAVGKWSELNGRWGIMLGQKINKRVVYKRDGEGTYLIYGDCGQFIMSEKLSGECNGVGINEKGSWVMEGKPMPIKVNPAGKKNFAEEDKKYQDEAKEAREKKQEAYRAYKKEQELIEQEASVNTFRGRMNEENEEGADRLMKKLNAKIVEGM